MKLEPHERDNPLWIRLREDLTKRLDTLRAKNDSPQLDALQTAHIRGQIAEVRALLEMEKEPPKI